MSSSGSIAVEDALYQQARYSNGHTAVHCTSFAECSNKYPPRSYPGGCRERTSTTSWSASEPSSSPVSEAQTVSHCYASSTYSQLRQNTTESESWFFQHAQLTSVVASVLQLHVPVLLLLQSIKILYHLEISRHVTVSPLGVKK